MNGSSCALSLKLPVWSSSIDLQSVTRYSSASEVNVLEESIKPLGDKVEFKPREVKFIKLVF
jgi:hypothetical protein